MRRYRRDGLIRVRGCGDCVVRGVYDKSSGLRL